MTDGLIRFRRIVERANAFTEARSDSCSVHPFDERNIHPKLPPIVLSLFDDGYYSHASFEAFKFLDKEVQRHAGESNTGFKLMMKAFDENNPLVKLSPLSSESEKNIQKGYRFLFTGAILAIRNPRGHEYTIVDSPDRCLDHLSLASLLLRRLERSGHRVRCT